MLISPQDYINCCENEKVIRVTYYVPLAEDKTSTFDVCSNHIEKTCYNDPDFILHAEALTDAGYTPLVAKILSYSPKVLEDMKIG